MPMRATLLLACMVLVASAGLVLVAGPADACVSVNGICILPGGSSCDPDGTCYPCDPRPGHPLDCV